MGLKGLWLDRHDRALSESESIWAIVLHVILNLLKSFVRAEKLALQMWSPNAKDELIYKRVQEVMVQGVIFEEILEF